jgi:hypothetical protein
VNPLGIEACVRTVRFDGADQLDARRRLEDARMVAPDRSES